MLKSLDSFYQRNVKKSENSTKIVITAGKKPHIDLTNFNEIFRKGVDYHNIKSQGFTLKKAGFYPLCL